MKKKMTTNNLLSDDSIKLIYSGDINLIKSIVNEANINNKDKDGRTTIFFAILSKSKEIVSTLLKNHPDINLKDKKGWSPLHYAAQNHLVDIADLLIKNGADIEIKDNYGNTPLWRAVYSSENAGGMIKLLLSKGADPNNTNDSGISPLTLAKKIANYDVKQFFS